MIKQKMIQILPTMVETELSFLKIEFELILRNTLEFYKTMFCITPKALDTVDMITVALGEFIITMINPKMFLKTDIN